MMEALAALIALVVVPVRANLAAVGLKDLIQPTVRSSVVGMVFASVPAVDGFSSHALNSFAPQRLAFPELRPWYVTGLRRRLLVFGLLGAGWSALWGEPWIGCARDGKAQAGSATSCSRKSTRCSVPSLRAQSIAADNPSAPPG